MCASLWFREVRSIAVAGPHQDPPSESVFAPHSAPFPGPVRSLRTQASARMGMTMFACLLHVANAAAATNATAAVTTITLLKDESSGTVPQLLLHEPGTLRIGADEPSKQACKGGFREEHLIRKRPSERRTRASLLLLKLAAPRNEIARTLNRLNSRPLEL